MFCSTELHPADGEMNQVTLPTRQIIRNSSPNGLQPKTLPLGHGVSYKTECLWDGKDWNLIPRAGDEPAISGMKGIRRRPTTISGETKYWDKHRALGYLKCVAEFLKPLEH